MDQPLEGRTEPLTPQCQGENLSDEIVAVFVDGTATIGELIEKTKRKGFGVLFVLFGLPNAIPLPVPPGTSIPFGIVLFILTVQLIMGRRTPWFPEWILKRKLTGATGKLFLKLGSVVKKIEKHLKPRKSWIYKGPLVRTFICPVLLAAAVCLCLPLPGTNTTPALGVGLIGAGMIEEDGLIGMIGMATVVVGLVIAAVFVTLLITGAKAVTG